MALQICLLTALLPGVWAAPEQESSTLLQIGGSRQDLAEDVGADDTAKRKLGRSATQDTSSLIMRMDGELRGLGDDLQDANLASRIHAGSGNTIMNSQAEPAVLLQQPGEPTMSSPRWVAGDKELDQATSQLFSAEQHAKEAEELLDRIHEQVYQSDVRQPYLQPSLPQATEDAAYLLNRRPVVMQGVDPHMLPMQGMDPHMQAMQAIGGAIFQGEEQAQQVQKALKAEVDSRKLTETLQAEVQRAEGGEATAQKQAKEVTQKAEETILGLWEQLQTAKAQELRATEAAKKAEQGLAEYRSLLEHSRSDLDRTRSELQQARLAGQQSSLELQAARGQSEMFRQQLEDAQAHSTAQSPGVAMPPLQPGPLPAWPVVPVPPLQAYPPPPTAAYPQLLPVQAPIEDPAMYLQSLGWRAQ
jgi:hypothetical protein